MSVTIVEGAEAGRVDRLRRLESAQPLDPYGRFLKLADVMQSIGVSQAMVYKLMHDERRPFPRPVKIGRASVWIERDVVSWKAWVAEEAIADRYRDDGRAASRSAKKFDGDLGATSEKIDYLPTRGGRATMLSEHRGEKKL